MTNLTLDHIKTIVQSVLASATRYKPNLSVTDPDDPRYVVGAEGMAGKVAKAQTTANAAKSLASQADGNALDALDMASTAQTTADNAKTTADNAKTTAATAQSTADTAKTAADNAGNNAAGLADWQENNIPSYDYNAPTYADGLWVTGSSSNSTGLWYSTDGKTWTRSNITSGYYYAPTYADGLWVTGSSSNSTGLWYSTTVYKYVTPAALNKALAAIDNTPTLTSPNGTKYTLSVDDDGNLSTTEVTDS